MNNHNWTPSQEERKQAVEAGETVIANMRKNGDTALIAWAKANGKFERIDRQSDWGNPFEIGKDGNRETVIAKYKDYFAGKPELQGRLGELRGKVLACWCCPAACHGEHLIAMATNNAAKAPL